MTDIPAGQVTAADLYRELSGLRADVARAVTQLEALSTRGADHEERIRGLEQFRWRLAGACVALSAAGTWLGWALHR